MLPTGPVAKLSRREIRSTVLAWIVHLCAHLGSSLPPRPWKQIPIDADATPPKELDNGPESRKERQGSRQPEGWRLSPAPLRDPKLGCWLLRVARSDLESGLT